MKTVLTIAGSDSSGGAGIQADIKTLLANGVYASSVITAITAQNTLGVQAAEPISPGLLRAQLDSVFTDIRPDAVKIGMIGSKNLILVISDALQTYRARNVILDPVMISTSGTPLLPADAVEALTETLFPQATLITPNIPEAAALTGLTIHNKADMLQAAETLSASAGCHVLVKGGHHAGGADDLLYIREQEPIWFTSPRIDNPNSHGTGCTLSSAIAANLAKGHDLTIAVDRAKKYLTGALAANLNLGKGSGPLDHGYALSGPFTER